MTLSPPGPIDPLRGGGPGRYEDEVVEVRLGGPVPLRAARTESFAVWSSQGRVHLVHRLPPGRIDNDLAGLVAEELFAPGWLHGSDQFERLVTGIVLSSADDPEEAWELFYRNTLDRLAELHAGVNDHGSLAAYAPVHAHVASLVGSGPVLELGSCFGFLSLQLATRAPVTASDVTPNTVRLLARVAPRLGVDLDTLICDAARVPRRDRTFETVLAVHLLEHLEPEHGAAVVAEMQRLASDRVVVAVPFEEEPTAAYGHVRTFDLATLHEIGRASGWHHTTYELHGGWLVLDRPDARGLR